VNGHQVDFEFTPIPIALDALGQGEIADSMTAAFLVQLPNEFLQRSSFGIRQSLVGFLD
jgi:hypothetical protein